jgi:hypothetical protein
LWFRICDIFKKVWMFGWRGREKERKEEEKRRGREKRRRGTKSFISGLCAKKKKPQADEQITRVEEGAKSGYGKTVNQQTQ